VQKKCNTNGEMNAIWGFERNAKDEKGKHKNRRERTRQVEESKARCEVLRRSPHDQIAFGGPVKKTLKKERKKELEGKRKNDLRSLISLSTGQC